MDLEDLDVAVGNGSIDTVLLALTDMQGRLQGKRLHGRYFLDEVVSGGSEGCNYLLAVDVDMNTVDGYAMSSWSSGYGDFVMKPDFGTLRRVPWQPGTALVLADLETTDGEPVYASPRQILQRQLDRLAEHGLTAFAGTELEFVLYRDSYEEAFGKNYREPDPGQPVQRGLFAARHRPGRAAAAPDPQRDVRRRPDPGERQGRVQLRPARDRLPLRRRAHLRRQPRDLQERGQGDRRPGGHGAHLHGQAERARGQLLPHPLLAARRGRALGDARRRARHTSASPGSGCWPGCSPRCASSACSSRPNINSYKRYQPGSFAPTALRWGVDNRTCALRMAGHGQGMRVENRVPGGDVNPYLAIAALVAGALHGIENELELEPEFTGNAYEDATAPRVPGDPARGPAAVARQ